MLLFVGDKSSYRKRTVTASSVTKTSLFAAASHAAFCSAVVGEGDGRLLIEGKDDGSDEGFEDGIGDGAEVGDVDGAYVGELEGAGETVGPALGWGEIDGAGDTVGLSVFLCFRSLVIWIRRLHSSFHWCR